MALTAANVRVAVTGAVYTAPAGTALPTDTTTALNVAFVELGYVSEDGITQSINSDTTTIKAWQNADTVRTLQTSHDLTYTLTLLETSTDVLKAYYSGAPTSSLAEIKGGQGLRQEWVIHITDGVKLIRLVIPDGQVTDQGDITYANADAIGYQITITCYPDGSGVKAYMYRS